LLSADVPLIENEEPQPHVIVGDEGVPLHLLPPYSKNNITGNKVNKGCLITISLEPEGF
jgi:hypothetical protein